MSNYYNRYGQLPVGSKNFLNSSPSLEFPHLDISSSTIMYFLIIIFTITRKYKAIVIIPNPHCHDYELSYSPVYNYNLLSAGDTQYLFSTTIKT